MLMELATTDLLLLFKGDDYLELLKGVSFWRVSYDLGFSHIQEKTLPYWMGIILEWAVFTKIGLVFRMIHDRGFC